MVLDKPRQPLQLRDIAVPSPNLAELLLAVRTCAVCRTDLHLIDGELPNPKLPVIPGHEIVGIVRAMGSAVSGFKIGDRVGVPWLGKTCGHCEFCLSGRENLCNQALFTGYTLDGGYAEFVKADARFCFRIPESYSDSAAAPLLCAGLIGYRCLRKTGDAQLIGLYGFGAAAHIIAQVIRSQGRKFYAFTRSGDMPAQRFAKDIGADWAGDSDAKPPELLDAAIIFAPVGSLVPIALRNLKKSGVVVCGGIHMSQIPAFDYELLWGERSIVSVANLTRRDGEEFFQIAQKFPIKTQTKEFPLEQANEALIALKHGRVNGAAVLRVWSGS
jgi:propanol-preferring alcohol dehydrogenase